MQKSTQLAALLIVLSSGHAAAGGAGNRTAGANYTALAAQQSSLRLCNSSQPLSTEGPVVGIGTHNHSVYIASNQTDMNRTELTLFFSVSTRLGSSRSRSLLRCLI